MAQIQMGLTDRKRWQAEARRWTAEHALRLEMGMPPISRMNKKVRRRAVFLLWVGKQMLPYELLDLWFMEVMPRALRVLRLGSPARCLAHAVNVSDDVFARYATKQWSAAARRRRRLGWRW